MDRYVEASKARVKLSLQNEADQTQTILGEAFSRNILWKGEHDSFIEKIIVKNRNIFYQIEGKTDILKVNDHGPSITPTEFYEPFFHTIKLFYPVPQFLTLGDTVVKTEQPCYSFIVAEHFTKKIYFIALTKKGGYALYAADISKGAKEVVAEKVDTFTDTSIYPLTALAVDQFSGEIVMAYTYDLYGSGKKQTYIQSWHKLAHLSEILTFAGISSSKKNVN